jgi:hypothetical protein
MDGGPSDDVVAEADRIIEAVRAAGIPARLTGGVAIRRRSRSAALEPLKRDYADVDLVLGKGAQKPLSALMVSLGYVPDNMFNTLHGIDRMYFVDVAHGRHVDVFVGSIRMCHTLDVSTRLVRLDDTLTVTDLLLTKLQVVELNHKDVIDLVAILLDHEVAPTGDDQIDAGLLEQLWAGDWPLWRTCGMTLEKVVAKVDQILPPKQANVVRMRVAEIEQVRARGRKSLAWKLRNGVGDRIRWYELPDEVDQ